MSLSSRMDLLGTEAAFEILKRAQEMESQGKSVVHLGIGQPDFLTPSHIVEAGRKALLDGHHGYTSANGIIALREAVTQSIYSRFRAKVDPHQIVVVPGGKPTIAFALLMFAEPGTEVLGPNPGFPIFESMTRFSGAKYVSYPLLEKNEFNFNAADVLSRITDKTRLLILNSPSNPTGGVSSEAELDRLVLGLEKFPKLNILSDEIYGRFVYNGRYYPSLLSYESIRNRLVVLDGCSKTYAMTGWRVGWGIWPSHLVEKATRLVVNFNSCTSAVSQWAAVEAISGSQIAAQEMVTTFSQRRDIIVNLINNLPGIHCLSPKGAFFVFANIRNTGMTATQLQNAWLEDLGVTTIAGTNFGSEGEGYVRFSFANSIENIEIAIKRIAGWLNDHDAKLLSRSSSNMISTLNSEYTRR